MKIVCPRTKDFSKEQVLLGGRHYALTEMLEWEKGQRPNLDKFSSFGVKYHISSYRQIGDSPTAVNVPFVFR